MRPGTGRRMWLLLLALATAGALAAVPAGAGSGSRTAGSPVGTAIERLAGGGGKAGDSGITTIFVIAGTASDNVLSLAADPSDRLVITSPQGIMEPDADRDECRQDSPTQVSCTPGFIDAIAGDLGPGDDSLTAQPSLRVLVGVSLVTEARWMAAGPGRDRISGGAYGDLITGGPGADTLLGFGGDDLIKGETGRDTLFGGADSDKLLGGKGADALRGGPAKDFCHGGPGIDTAKSCNVARRIP